MIQEKETAFSIIMTNYSEEMNIMTFVITTHRLPGAREYIPYNWKTIPWDAFYVKSIMNIARLEMACKPTPIVEWTSFCRMNHGQCKFGHRFMINSRRVFTFECPECHANRELPYELVQMYIKNAITADRIRSAYTRVFAGGFTCMNCNLYVGYPFWAECISVKHVEVSPIKHVCEMGADNMKDELSQFDDEYCWNISDEIVREMLIYGDAFFWKPYSHHKYLRNLHVCGYHSNKGFLENKKPSKGKHHH